MQVDHKAERTWEATPFEGIERSLFRTNEDGGRTSVVRLRKGAHFPRHRHRANEDVLVLEGCVVLAGATLNEGDYLHTGPGEEHDIEALEDSVIFVSSQKPTDFVG